MLAMAVPIAIVRLLHADRPRSRIAYGLAGCVLMVGILATQRKTGIVAPLAGVLTLAYFRRRELLKLAPVAVVMLVALLIVSPRTISPVVEQFSPNRLGAETVSDRASDYDAIRPDVWTHIAFGRGFGSYQPLGHRILDSEILLRTIEMGVLGLAAFFILGGSVVAHVRSTIASRHPEWETPALASAAAAVIFLVVAFLFDEMSYPQVTYIFLCFAAFAAAIHKPQEDG
jgi:4-amino-4-deoxy-L-arabinose transferase-like glycosyltransferase